MARARSRVCPDRGNAAPQEPAGLIELAKDTTKLSNCAEAGITVEELADYFGVDKDAMVKTFGAVLRKARAALQLRVRRTMLAQADRGVPEALNYLWGAYVMSDESVEVRPNRRR